MGWVAITWAANGLPAFAAWITLAPALLFTASRNKNPWTTLPFVGEKAPVGYVVGVQDSVEC